MRRFAIGLLVAASLATAGCRGMPGGGDCGTHVPRYVEMGKAYDFVFARTNAVMKVRIEDIDESAGWVRVRRMDNSATWWVNMATVERILVGE